MRVRKGKILSVNCRVPLLICDQNEAFLLVLANLPLISLEDLLEVSSWPLLWTEHAGLCQRVCYCSIATISGGGRSFGGG